MFKDYLKKHIDLVNMLLIAVFSFLFFYNFNAISPVNDEVVFENDLALFYTAGVSMKRVLVLYKDIFDHKGPYVFILYYLASLLGEMHHIGLYIFFSIFHATLAIFIYKIILIYKDNKNIALLTALSTFLYIFNDFTSYANMSAEHSTYLYVVISMYLFLKNRKKYYDNVEVNDYKNIFFIGIFAGIILMVKMNNVLMVLAIAIIYLIDIIKNKNYKKILLMLFFGILGVVTGILPGLIYLMKHNALKEFIETYIIFNTKYLGSEFILFRRYTGYTESLFEILNKFKIVFLMSFLSIFIMYKNLKKYSVNGEANSFHKEKFVFYLLSVVFTIVNIMLMKRSYSYYTCVLVIGFVPLSYYIISLISKIIKNYIASGIVVISVLYIISYLFIGNNIILRKHQYKDINSFRVAFNNYKEENNLMNKQIKFLSISSPNYYLVFDEVPACKYYVRPMIERARFKDYYETIENDVYNFKYDIFVLSYAGDFATYFSDEFYDFVRDNYKVLATINNDKLLVKR